MRTHTALVIAGTLFLLAFRGNDPAAPKKTTYGTCGCGETERQFQLTVSDDNTFRYVRFDAAHPVDVSGTWESGNGNTILLRDYPAGVKIHDKWKLETNYPCITSRKGMEFSRLCSEKCD